MRRLKPLVPITGSQTNMDILRSTSPSSSERLGRPRCWTDDDPRVEVTSCLTSADRSMSSRIVALSLSDCSFSWSGWDWSEHRTFRQLAIWSNQFLIEDRSCFLHTNSDRSQKWATVLLKHIILISLELEKARLSTLLSSRINFLRWGVPVNCSLFPSNQQKVSHCLNAWLGIGFQFIAYIPE